MSIESKTKEQILDEVYNKSYDSLDGYSQTTALKAMDIHARSRAIDVLRWAASNKLEFLLGVWCDNNTAYDSIEDVINAYELFSQQIDNHSIDK